MRSRGAIALLPALAAAAAATAGSAASPTHCQAKSIGPGSLRRGGTTGAACLLAAFRDGCRPADYMLSQFGVDTIHSLTFATRRRSFGCTVLVTESFRVVPQRPRVTGRYVCLRLRPLAAERCTPSRTISLTTIAG